jgi:sulfite exporter TauE/SafE
MRTKAMSILCKKEMKQNILSSLSIGFIHGLAGVAHFILLLPVLAFETRFEGTQFILGFAIGTVLAMTIYGFILGNIAKLSKNANDPLFFKGIRFAGGFVCYCYWCVFGFI